MAAGSMRKCYVPLVVRAAARHKKVRRVPRPYGATAEVVRLIRAWRACLCVIRQAHWVRQMQRE